MLSQIIPARIIARITLVVEERRDAVPYKDIPKNSTTIACPLTRSVNQDDRRMRSRPRWQKQIAAKFYFAIADLYRLLSKWQWRRVPCPLKFDDHLFLPARDDLDGFAGNSPLE